MAGLADARRRAAEANRPREFWLSMTITTANPAAKCAKQRQAAKRGAVFKHLQV